MPKLLFFLIVTFIYFFPYSQHTCYKIKASMCSSDSHHLLIVVFFLVCLLAGRERNRQKQSIDCLCCRWRWT